MNTEEFNRMAQKVLRVAPVWLKRDIINIVEKEGEQVRISHAISILYHQYSFNLGHIFTAMDQSFDWSKTASTRLNYIDNNIDLVELMLKEAKKYNLEINEETAE